MHAEVVYNHELRREQRALLCPDPLNLTPCGVIQFFQSRDQRVGFAVSVDEISQTMSNAVRASARPFVASQTDRRQRTGSLTRGSGPRGRGISSSSAVESRFHYRGSTDDPSQKGR